MRGRDSDNIITCPNYLLREQCVARNFWSSYSIQLRILVSLPLGACRDLGSFALYAVIHTGHQSISAHVEKYQGSNVK